MTEIASPVPWSWVNQPAMLRPTGGRRGRYSRPLSIRDAVIAGALGREIRRLRKLRELSQYQLADLVGVSQPAINQIERTRRASIHARQLFDFAEALGVPADHFTKTCMTAVDAFERRLYGRKATGTQN